ncbi:hypothetical protein F4780DRAFT_164809 [Xylariomycetidae sp. FL0641]|nr:hypothetical protein F4780DRAFT_164809 [Xylariomycetidae sp. FL0641]
MDKYLASGVLRESDGNQPRFPRWDPESDKMQGVEFYDEKPKNFAPGIGQPVAPKAIQTQFGHPPPAAPARFSLKGIIRNLDPERSLEDLYQDYPEKRLEDMQRSIQQSTLQMAANVVLQITDEGLEEWLETWAPGMKWENIFDHIRRVDCEEDPETILFLVPNGALNLRGLTTTLAQLYRQCHQARDRHPITRLADLVRLIDHCIFFCGVLKDLKRKVLLELSKDEMQWIPVGLDCKKLDIHKEASARLQQLNKELSDSNPGQSKTARTRRNRRKRAEEQKILDVALLDFEIKRAESRKQFLNALNVMLQVTKAASRHLAKEPINDNAKAIEPQNRT